MITIKVVVLTLPPPVCILLLHCSPRRNPRNVAVFLAFRLVSISARRSLPVAWQSDETAKAAW
jgi:hypothetical protein